MSGTVELEASHKRRLIRDIGPGRQINEGSGVTEVLYLRWGGRMKMRQLSDLHIHS